VSSMPHSNTSPIARQISSAIKETASFAVALRRPRQDSQNPQMWAMWAMVLRSLASGILQDRVSNQTFRGQ
jgi:hypothetical protein